ncbi:MAG: DUF3995 domain-containing protein [Thermoanaerobaculia bacterium]
MSLLLGYTTSVIFTALALLHFFWAAGGRWGSRVAIPERGGRPAFHPGPGATILVGLLLLAAAAVLLARLGHDRGRLPRFIPMIGPWVLFAVFLVRAIGDFRLVGFFKTQGAGTAFAQWDTMLFSPISLVLAVGCLAVALRP